MRRRVNGRRSSELNRLYNLANRGVSVEGKCCEKCGATGKLHRHHPDYSKPLDVVVLCRACHQAEHPRPAAEKQATIDRNERIAAYYEAFLSGSLTRQEMYAKVEAEGIASYRANSIYRRVRGLAGATKREAAA